jgi:hypothetical protein
MTCDELIRWFWDEFAQHPPSAGDEISMCQCASESFIEGSDSPTQMRTFLLVGVFLDQYVHRHFPEVYLDFQTRFRFPKLRVHGEDGMKPANWFLYSRRCSGKEIDWASADDVARPIVDDVLTWLDAKLDDKNLVQTFREIADARVRAWLKT